VTGGRRPNHLERGFFIEPTLFADVRNSSTIAQEEIFGPVLCVIPADDEEQAIEIANETIYGLNNSVYTTSASPWEGSNNPASVGKAAVKGSCPSSNRRRSSSTPSPSG
jgi:acyl-CoA reductase-like NAD-dependent aldehyde dehydrogenase